MAAFVFASVLYLFTSESLEFFSVKQYAPSNATYLKLTVLDEVIDHPHADTKQASRCFLVHQEGFRLLV